MREAKFILPYATPGAPTQGHLYARQKLTSCFGGYTAMNVHGSWVDSHGDKIDEASVQYTVAMIDGFTQFRAIALEAGRLDNQQAVYIVSPTGEAEIVDIRPGKTNRVVEPDPEPRRPQVDEVWLTRDGKNKVLVLSTKGSAIFGRVIKGSYASPMAQLCFEHDGHYAHLGGDNDIDLVEYITTI